MIFSTSFLMFRRGVSTSFTRRLVMLSSVAGKMSWSSVAMLHIMKSTRATFSASCGFAVYVLAICSALLTARCPLACRPSSNMLL